MNYCKTRILYASLATLLVGVVTVPVRAADIPVKTAGESAPQGPQPMAIGGWLFSPTLFAGAVYNSNVNQTEAGKISSWGERVVPGFSDGIKLACGDLLRVISSGGGGHGDPLQRDAARVQDDVADGFVSVMGALADYGVVIDATTLEVDTAATLCARTAQRAHRTGPLPFFDRGAQFEALEAQRGNESGASAPHAH